MTGDEVDDRLSKRFSTESDDAGSKATSTSSGPDTNAQTSQKAQNIKKEWNVRSFYLDDELDDELTTAFKQLDLNLTESTADIPLKKTRHFYPLIVQLGLEQLEELDATEVAERLE